MGVRTRGLDMQAGFKRDAAERAARGEAEAVIQRWNDHLVLSRDVLWSPTIRAALIAGTPWLDVFCLGSGTSRAIDLRKVDRHLLASVATLVLGLRCFLVPGNGANAQGPRPACPAACREARILEPMIRRPDCVRPTHGVEVATAA
jgi:hypothetical protein